MAGKHCRLAFNTFSREIRMKSKVNKYNKRMILKREQEAKGFFPV